MQSNLAQRPPHVPQELVVDWDLYHPRGGEKDIHLAWKAFQETAPDFVWTPHLGGHWIVMRGEDIDFIQRNHDPFSMQHITLPVGYDRPRILPLEADPPEHADFRALLNTWFTPKAVKPMEDQARALAIQLIEGFKSKGGCEFISEFAMHLPINVFLHLVELPLSDRDQLLAWTNESARASTAEARMAVFQKTGAYLSKVIEARKTKPGDDLFSRIIHGKVFGRAMKDDEIMGMCLTVLFGGLDTVASSMGFVARFLAENPVQRKELADNPALIPTAVDEFFRRFGVSSTTRTMTRDFEYKGVHFKKGDRIYVFAALYGLDERKFDRPLEVDFHRGNVIHAAFGAGPHRCPGSFLARSEIKVFLEEWLKRIPDFRIKPGETPHLEAGLVNCVHTLPLVWDIK